MSIRFLIGLLLLSSLFWVSCSEDTPDDLVEDVCGEIRYSTALFDEVQKTTVKFGQNLNVDGTLIELFMDIYEPVGDNVEKRPAMIWAFGGAFISGIRQSMEPYAIDVAKHGIVGATFDYRILDISNGVPDSSAATDIAIKAMGDMKAAIRHLRMDAATTNDFRVDPEKIFIGGVSAGAITALQVAMIDSDDIIPSYIQNVIDENGGLEGNSGDAINMQYSSEVSGIISLSGGIFDISWIDSNDPPILSMHGDADQVVKYGYDYAMVNNIPIVLLYGSQPIHEKATEVNLTNVLLTVQGGGHGDIYLTSQFQAARDQFNDLLYQFYVDFICI
jgi:hypothetical protein